MRYLTAFLLLFFMPALNGLYGQSVAELEARLRRSTSKNEQMSLSYDLAQKLLSSNTTKAIDYANRASDLAVQLGEKRTAAEATYLSAEGSFRRRDYRNASAGYIEAWNMARNYGLRDLALDAVGRLEEIGTRQNDLKEALKWSRESVNYLKENTGRSSSGGDVVRRLENQIQQLENENRQMREELSQLTGQTQSYESNYRQTEAQLKEFHEKSQEELLKKEDTISQIIIEKQRVDSVAKIKDQLVYRMTKEQLADSIIKTQFARELEQQKVLTAEAELARQESENLRNILALLSGFVFVLAFLFYLRYLAKKRTANALSEKNSIIEEEQRKSDSLLLNILPAAIAQELKERDKVTAKKYDQATVMFVDFTGFTRVAEKLGPEDLVAELDYCFSNFDRIISKYNIEKIKTVGDAYICASGLSDKNATPSDMIKAALEIQDFLLHTKAIRMDQGLPFFEARLGIHTGPVVAGVVGKKKFAYDIWGDTVNVAARMEESCEPGRVNVSEDTYLLSKYEFEWQYRGKIAAKNKGLMDMHYVTTVKKY